jgi:peptide deformylase
VVGKDAGQSLIGAKFVPGRIPRFSGSARAPRDRPPDRTDPRSVGQVNPVRLQIVEAGEEVLRTSARELSREEILQARTRDLIEHMRDTMRYAPGVGLAAPQVGEGLQLAVIEDRPEYQKKLSASQLAERLREPVPFHVIINPRIVSSARTSLAFFEGCLSIPGYSAVVPRSRSVTVEYLDEHAQKQRVDAVGWYARILQHEIDHLGGILYVDRMQARTWTSLNNLDRVWKDVPLPQVLARLNPGDKVGKPTP